MWFSQDVKVDLDFSRFMMQAAEMYVCCMAFAHCVYI